MYWLKEWIWQIAGIIILSSVCDMIVPGGEMKKYVKLVMGLILVVAVIRPLVGVPAISAIEIEKTETRRKATELKTRLDEKEMFNVIKVYKEKLCRKIEEQLDVVFDTTAEVKVELEIENEDNFGDITGVTVLMHTGNNTDGMAEDVRKTVSESVGIEPDRVRVVMLSKSDGKEGV